MSTTRDLLRRSTVVTAVCLVILAASGASALAASPRPPATPACTITGTAAGETLNGTDGDDVICGLGGNDVLIGNGGNDILIGGGGNDTLEGDEGDDTLDGGAGVDTCVQGTGNGNISNCETLAEPAFSVSDATVAEGAPGDNNQLVFTITLASPLAVTSTADFATADGTAQAPSDYTAASSTATFAPGVTQQQVSIGVVGDRDYEPDETMQLMLSNPVAGTLGDATGTGTITNDDPQYQLNIGDATAAENKPALNFKVTITPASTDPTYVQYQTADGTAVSGVDYNGAIGVLAIPAGATVGHIRIVPIDNDADQPDRSFTITLSNPVGATIIDGTATGTVLDDDATPTITINDASVAEGNSGITEMPFTATLSGPSRYTVTADLTLVDGTALKGFDYDNESPDLTFPPGTTTQNFSVGIKGDITPEDDESFSMKAVFVDQVVATGTLATGTILNDDAGIVIDAVGNPPLRSNGVSSGPVVSADGRYVAFIAAYGRNAKHAYSTVFVRDRSTGVLTSITSSQIRGGYDQVSISGDGRYIAYFDGTAVRIFDQVDKTTSSLPNQSSAPSLDGDGNLVAFHTSTTAGIRLENRSTAAITVVTDQFSTDPVISADGSTIAYETTTDSVIHVYNAGTGVTTVASIASDGTAADKGSTNPSISADGRYIAFASPADNLVTGDTNTAKDSFVHDMVTNTTVRVSVAADGSQLAAGGGNPSISADGNRIAFISGSSLLVREPATTVLVVTASLISSPDLSGDGSSLGFVAGSHLVDGQGSGFDAVLAEL